MQSLLYICLLLSGYVKDSTKLYSGREIFRDKTLTRHLRRTMSMRGQSDKSIAVLIYQMSNKTTKAPWCLPLITLHQWPTLEASNHQTKNHCSSKNYTQLYSLPSDLLYNIGMWHTGLVYCNKLKPVLLWIKQKNPVLCASTSYKIKYAPFDY